MCENPKTIARQQVGHALCQQPILKAAAAQHDRFQAGARAICRLPTASAF